MNIQLVGKIDDLGKWILRAFESAKIEDSLNNARKAGESLCKIVILKHYGEERGTKLILGQENLKGGRSRLSQLDYNGLIDLVVYEQDPNFVIIKSKSERHKIKSYLESIRTHANPASHDANFPKESSRLSHARLAQFNLSMLVSWFYKEFLQEPIPEILIEHLNEAEATYVEPESETPPYEDLRGLDIVKILYPKQKNSIQADIKDSSKKIGYEFVTTDITGNIKIGYLFVKKKVSITATLQHFIDNLKFQLTSLIICSPREISPITGKEVTTRLKYIQEEFAELAPKSVATEIYYYFIDDFMWQFCLNERTEVLDLDLAGERYFVDQELFRLQDGQQIDLQFSLEYIKQLINSPEKEKPVSVILGRAGVGKTTFCEQVVEMVNKKLDRKKALFISSTDLRNVQSDFPVNSVTDIYRLYLKAAEAGLGEILEPNSFEINVSCGNIVLIIDGLDEIESFLKDKFDLDLFLESAVYLNQAYKNCSILITSRDYFLDKYLEKDSINIFQLLGFNQEMVNLYLEKRLDFNTQKIKEAKKYLANFDITEQNRHPPLIVSLICDLIDREEYDNATPRHDIKESRYFYAQAELDPLIYELLQREIGKQSLDISCDDYYELIEDLSVKKQGIITKAALNDYIEVLLPSVEMTSNDNSTKYTQFYNSPLWSHNTETDTFKIKYDFVELWSKVRFTLHNFETENLNDDLTRLLIELYDGTSILLEEIIKMKKITQIDYVVNGKQLLRKLINQLRELDKGNKSIQIQQAVSGLLYLVLSEETVKSRDAYSDALVELYGSENIYYLCIYGDFFPLDFTKLRIYEGWFEQYGNFDKCRLPSDSKVFYYSTFKGIDPKFSTTPNWDLFDSTCKLNDELKSAFDDSLNSAGKLYEQVRNNLKRIMQVSFHAGGFVLKSEVMHRNAAIKGSASLEQYTRFLTLEGVLEKHLKTGSGTGYLMTVSKGFRDSAKNLIANNIVKPDLEVVIKKMLKKFHNL